MWVIRLAMTAAGLATLCAVATPVSAWASGAMDFVGSVPVPCTTGDFPDQPPTAVAVSPQGADLYVGTAHEFIHVTLDPVTGSLLSITRVPDWLGPSGPPGPPHRPNIESTST